MSLVSSPTQPLFDLAQLRAFLAATLEPAVAAGLGCMEMRLFEARFNFKTGFIEPATFSGGNTLSGWYDRADTLIADVQRLKGVSAYVTVNPVLNDLLSLSYNKLAKVKTNTTDNDIAQILNLFLDCDPVRKTGISSTDAELAAALARRDQILADFPEVRAASIRGSSGNGGLILARTIGYPNDEEHRRLLARVIDGFSLAYSDQVVGVDQKTKNPSRVMALPGTLKCKGDARPERPHRLAAIHSPLGSQGDALDFRAIIDRLPDPGVHKTTVQVPAVRATQAGREKGQVPARPGDQAQDFIVKRCRAVIFGDRFHPSVEGQNGHGALVHAAEVIWNEFGLGDDVGLPLFEEWNQSRAFPPEDDKQVRHKWESVKRRHPVPGLGMLREARRDEPSRGQQQNPGDNGNGIIIVTNRLNEVADQAVLAMGSLQEVYQRGNELVRVLRDSAPTKKIIRPPGSPRIALMPKPRLQELMSVAASWKSYTETGKLRDAAPTMQIINIMMARGEWDNIRHLEAVIETPVIRKDGTVLSESGWDPGTTLLFEPEISFPPFLDVQPSREDAQSSAVQILDVVSQFPFVGPAHSAAWLAALLTPLARFAIDGPCPLFLFDANAPGSGKSLLCDLIAIIATGRTMPRTAYPEGDDEMRKRITSIALAGDRLMMLDNIATAFGGSALDGMLTARTWKDRILGRSEMSSELPLFTVWYGTGNNVALRGDALRRVLPCRLEAKDERPEERTEFVHERIGDWVTKERGRLVVACLTILSAYLRAGKPERLPALGSFESWSDVVRSAVHWATGVDPCLTRKELTATDNETNIRTALIEGWQELDWDGKGKTTAQALQALKENPNGNATLHAAAMEISRTDGLPSPVLLSRHLRKIKGRVVNGKLLSCLPNQGTMVWKVVEVGSDSEGIHSRGVRGVRGVEPATPREGYSEQMYQEDSDVISEQELPHVPHVPHEDQDDLDGPPF